MRGSIVRLVALREIRELLRDRRTLFLVFALPILLYPVFGVVGWVFARSIADQAVIVGIVGRDQLPPGLTLPIADQFFRGSLGTAATIRAKLDYPGLIEGDQFVAKADDSQLDIGTALVLRDLDSADQSQLDDRQVDVILVIPNGMRETLNAGNNVEVKILSRDGDETSKLAVRRLTRILRGWERDVRWTRFTRAGLPANFADPLRIIDPIESKGQLKKTTDELRDTLVKFFPFLLIMWTMAGALHPAVDITAGEKERGTMETLLISPAERVEIVIGKLLAVMTFSFGTAFWNVFWMGGGAVVLSYFLPFNIVSYSGLAWCILLTIPLAGLFSAISLAMGIYARSTKEGQYYLMPLFLITMPLAFWAMTPGIRLSWELSLIPITGMALLQQALMSPTPGPSPWIYAIPVLASLTLCMALAIWWAVKQFHSERVLFRESETGGMAMMWRRWRKRPGTIATTNADGYTQPNNE